RVTPWMANPCSLTRKSLRLICPKRTASAPSAPMAPTNPMASMISSDAGSYESSALPRAPPSAAYAPSNSAKARLPVGQTDGQVGAAEEEVGPSSSPLSQIDLAGGPVANVGVARHS